MTPLAMTLSGIAIVTGACTLAWQGNGTEPVDTAGPPVQAPQAAHPALHPPTIDLGRLAQVCGQPV